MDLRTGARSARLRGGEEDRGGLDVAHRLDAACDVLCPPPDCCGDGGPQP